MFEPPVLPPYLAPSLRGLLSQFDSVVMNGGVVATDGFEVGAHGGLLAEL